VIIKSGPPPKRENGFALVLVLWLVALLSIVAASFSTHSKVETRLAGNAVKALQSKLLAESGVNGAVLELMVSDSAQRWHTDGQNYPVETDQGRINISIRNSSGLLDLNKSSHAQLARLFGLLTDDVQDREALADRLADWRDNDDLRRLKGAEDVDYRAADEPFTTPGRDLVSMDELAYVMGFDAATVELLRPYVTLYSELQGVDIRYAPQRLVSLLKGEQQDSKALAEALDYIESDLADLEGEGPGTQSTASVYRIQIEAHTPQGARAQVLTDIDLKGQDDTFYSIRSWHDSL
jgi:general secretion pathway protein K